ncbi:MAG: HepT-like ribonuclease domain-containing protein [Candidatus Methanospirareceae archaeon]
MRRRRYLEKLEVYEGELEFIRDHSSALQDDVTGRALLYSLEVCVDVVMDVVAMTTRDLGLTVEDDYTNIEKLEHEQVLAEREGDLLRRYNGLRNAIVHKYNQLDLDAIQRGLERIEALYELLEKLVAIVEREGALEGE